jgi:hypothetical protein
MNTAKSPGAVAAHWASEIDQLEARVNPQTSLHRRPTQAPGSIAEPAQFLRRQAALFETRCRELAVRVQAGVISFVDAVDLAYEAAIWSGISDSLGDDFVQKIMADAFMGTKLKGTG